MLVIILLRDALQSAQSVYGFEQEYSVAIVDGERYKTYLTVSAVENY